MLFVIVVPCVIIICIMTGITIYTIHRFCNHGDEITNDEQTIRFFNEVLL